MSIAEYPVFMWSLLIVAFLIIVALHFIENKNLITRLRQKFDGDDTKHIMHFAWSRSIQFICAVALLFIIISFYDLKLRGFNSKLQNIELVQAIDKIIPLQAPLPPREENDVLPVELFSTIAQDSIQDIFSGADDPGELGSKINNIKSRYEELLVNYLLMDKCKIATDDDYDIITRVLQKEISQAGAPQHLEADILDAAKGSYEELYSEINCSDPFIEHSSVQYRDFIISLSKKLAPL